MEPVILASGSLRRQEYFRLLGIPFSIMPAQIDETVGAGGAFPPNPRSWAEEMAVRKVRKIMDILSSHLPGWIFGADTLISVDDEIYGKPADREDAHDMLLKLQGRSHEVITAMALYNGKERAVDCRSTISVVSFAPLTQEDIDWYLDTGEWQGVAGAYKIQGLASCFISNINGSYSGIVGLPLREFYVMLKENGYDYG
jgi:septum formation protein